MLYKADWNEVRDRFTAWWRREPMDRPVMAVRAPREKLLAADAPRPPENATARWLDFDGVLARAEADFAKTAYLGEVMPSVCASLGPGALGTYLGADPVFQPNTVWYEPCFDDVRSAHLKLDAENRWWKWTLESTRTAVSRAEGRYLTGMPDLIENADTLAALLDNHALLYYLVDAPEDIHRLQRELLPLWFEAFDALFDIIKDGRGGNVFTPFDIWGPGRTAKLQCDFSAMISPAMFEEFVAPYLREQCDRLDYSLYHLDGPDAVCHLDVLLSIESLDCIQWTPGAGEPGGGSDWWDEICRKTLDAGKCIQTQMGPGEVKSFVRRFGKRSIYIRTNASSEAEGRELLAEGAA